VTRRAQLEELHRAALDAAHAGRALERAFAASHPGEGPFVVLGAGKAACAIADAAERVLGARIRRGVVTTKLGHARALARCQVREASHPLPDENGEAAAREALAIAESLVRDEELLVLLSGGASALWCAPAPGLSLADKRRVTELLLARDVDIRGLNTVRRHLSALKGGGLARAARGRAVRAYAVSDVRGDRLEDLASGPVSPDPTHSGDALSVLREHQLIDEVPRAVRAHLERGAGETAKPGDPALAKVDMRVIASLDVALDAAVRRAESLGLRARVLRDALYGEVESVAQSLASAARAARRDGFALVVAGGEPTVRVRGPGRGGRAQELALRLALALEGESDWHALCAGTDGTDGATDAAGAHSDATTLARAAARGLDVRATLARSDSHPLLAALGDLYVTGPTDTNVADLALVLV